MPESNTEAKAPFTSLWGHVGDLVDVQELIPSLFHSEFLKDKGVNRPCQNNVWLLMLNARIKLYESESCI